MLKVQYKTKHRDELTGYLETIPGQHITVSEICAHFKEQGNPIGTTTVYRHLERMVDEGLVKKYIIDANSPACFEYVSKREEAMIDTCFHCKCERCGRLIHLHCEDLIGLQEHLAAAHHFHVNPMRTVFYGLCDECARALEEPLS